jgi:acyl-CoA synthetase (AMP-forming)/AMP-acid ligase II
MIFRSPYPDIDLPNIPITRLVLRHADRLANKAALIDALTGRQITYGELRDSISRAAAGLSSHGVRQGDVVAIYAPNSIEYVIAFHAIATLGATVSTVNPLYLTEEGNRQLNQHDVKFIVTSEELLDRAEVAIAGTPVGAIFVIGEAQHHLPFESLLTSRDDVPAVQIDPRNDVVALLCSSGTTGMPKGVMLTHRALGAMALIPEGISELAETDVVPGHLPLFHAFGVFTTLTSCLASGTTSVILPKFEFEQFLRMIQDYRVNRAFAAPPILVQLAKNPIVDDYDLSSLKAITCAAAPLGAELEVAVRERIGCIVKQGYGMTEIAPSHVAPINVPASKQGSVGVCVPSTDAMIVDLDTRTPVGPGLKGEIWLRGPAAMKGYLNDPEATAATLDSEGWIHSGDIGYADEDGYFYIVDRLKELIKYKAYQVAPAELEAVLLSHPAVADVAVIRSPDEDAGEVPKAFVVLKAPATDDELMEYVGERVAPYKKVRRVEFIDVIPKSATGKLLRRVLVERELGQQRELSLV